MVKRSIKLYPTFYAFSGDLIFFVPIDTLFLTLVKGLNISLQVKDENNNEEIKTSNDKKIAFTSTIFFVILSNAIFYSIILMKYELIVIEFILLILSIVEITVNKKMCKNLEKLE